MTPNRVLLKLSGEALAGKDIPKFPYDPATMLQIAEEIKAAHDKGVEVGIVVGGGNIFRGAKGASEGMNRTLADQFGMLATIQNGLALLDLLERICRLQVRLMSGLRCDKVAEPYIMRKAVRHLQEGRVVILAGGTGNPYCTTDYAAALRANEIGAKLLAKATNIDGIYDKDPNKHKDAVRLVRITYQNCLDNDLKVMDAEAFALCRDQQMPIRVFSLRDQGNITSVLTGADIGSLVVAALSAAPIRSAVFCLGGIDKIRVWL